jgi:DNA-binding FadR family transcriptional regulator
MEDYDLFAPTALDASGVGAGRSLLLTPIRGGNTYEEAVERILHTIRLGLVQAGEQLPPERELATMFEISRDTVREAIASLTDAGYLIIRRGRYGGTFVADAIPEGPVVIGRDRDVSPRLAFTAPEIHDVLVLRSVLEPGAAYHAATSDLTGEMREKLWAAHQETASADPRDYRRFDSRLHLLIAELTGSNALVNQVAQTRVKVNELLDEIPLLPPNIAHSNSQHEAIVMAILTGRADDAEAAMRDHLSGSAALLRGFLS